MFLSILLLPLLFASWWTASLIFRIHFTSRSFSTLPGFQHRHIAIGIPMIAYLNELQSANVSREFNFNFLWLLSVHCFIMSNDFIGSSLGEKAAGTCKWRISWFLLIAMSREKMCQKHATVETHHWLSVLLRAGFRVSLSVITKSLSLLQGENSRFVYFMRYSR